MLKKGVTTFYLVVAILFLVGCNSKVTQKELMDNTWEVIVDDSKEKEELSFIAEFTKTQAVLSVDASQMKSQALDDYEKLGEEFAKTLLSNLNYKLTYELKGDTIHLKNTDFGIDDDFTIKKEKKTIVLSSPESDEQIILTPFKRDTTSK